MSPSRSWCGGAAPSWWSWKAASNSSRVVHNSLTSLGKDERQANLIHTKEWSSDETRYRFGRSAGDADRARGRGRDRLQHRMVGRGEHPPAGRDAGRRRARAVLRRLWLPPVLRVLRDLLVPADPVRHLLAVPPGLLGLRRTPDDGRRLGPRPRLGLRSRPQLVRGAGAGVAQAAARRAAAFFLRRFDAASPSP